MWLGILVGHIGWAGQITVQMSEICWVIVWNGAGVQLINWVLWFVLLHDVAEFWVTNNTIQIFSRLENNFSIKPAWWIHPLGICRQFVCIGWCFLVIFLDLFQSCMLLLPLHYQYQWTDEFITRFCISIMYKKTTIYLFSNIISKIIQIQM